MSPVNVKSVVCKAVKIHLETGRVAAFIMQIET